MQLKRGLYNDICLIQFEERIPCDEKTRPICVADSMPQKGRQCHVAGFGDQTGLDQYAQTLQQGLLTIQDHGFCRNLYGHNGLDESFFCAANQTHGIDTCQGDSGGPLTCVNNNVHYLYGITSFGVGCNDQHYPGAYTDVSHYKSWIRQTMFYEPCATAPTTCGSVITQAPGTLTVERDTKSGRYLNNQVQQQIVYYHLRSLIFIRSPTDY